MQPDNYSMSTFIRFFKLSPLQLCVTHLPEDMINLCMSYLQPYDLATWQKYLRDHLHVEFRKEVNVFGAVRMSGVVEVCVYVNLKVSQLRPFTVRRLCKRVYFGDRHLPWDDWDRKIRSMRGTILSPSSTLPRLPTNY